MRQHHVLWQSLQPSNDNSSEPVIEEYASTLPFLVLACMARSLVTCSGSILLCSADLKKAGTFDI